ncbi:MAG: hypothetical protein AOA65_0078 [Candidatus Bathyarchaeota archaeon BA1]|nr:MAG: hypothetical protein AOA65_0078 [Candidatus Bathyarchaeota archaeon BA1]
MNGGLMGVWKKLSKMYGLILLKIKEMLIERCPECGTTLTGEENYCPKCGRARARIVYFPS